MRKLSISIKKEQEALPDNSEALAALDAEIVAVAEMRRTPSKLTLRRYLAIFRSEGDAKQRSIADSKVTLTKEAEKEFIRLMVLAGDPVVVDAHRKSDFLSATRKRAASIQTSQKN